jgi:hypothetical protein
MSDLNWNKLPWRKSSFSSDSANCVEVSWTRSSACHQGSCVKVGWTASSRCAGGDCVQVRHDDGVVYVRDSKLGDDSPVQEWPLTYWEFLCDAIVADLPRFSGYRKLDGYGCVELRWAHIHPAPLIFDAGEWKAFVLGVRAGEFDPATLSSKFQSSSFGRGVIEEEGAGAPLSGGAPAQPQLSSPVAASRGGEPAAGRPVGSDTADGSGHAAAGAGITGRDTPAPVAAEKPLADAAPDGGLVAEIPLGGAASADGSGLRPSPATGTGDGLRGGVPVPVAAESSPPDDWFARQLDADCASIDTPADRLAGRGSLLPASTPDDPRSGGQPGPYVAEITWSEDPSLGEPQGSPVGRPVDASTDEVDLSSAVQPGSDAAGTGTPPVPVPAAQPRPIISDEAVEVLARRLHRSRYYGPMVDDVRDDHRWNELLIDREREEYRDAARAHLAAVYPLLRERWEAWSADDEEAWARAVAPLVSPDGVL